MKGWKDESHRHRLAGMGIKTTPMIFTSRGNKCIDDPIWEAQKHFGVTSIYEEAGYILPDGQLLDLSKEDTPYTRELHDEVEEITGCSLWEFMYEGAVRIHITSEGGQTLNIEVMKPLTRGQQRAIQYIMQSRPVVMIDVHIPNSRGDIGTDLEYRKFKYETPSKVIGYINRMTNDFDNIKHPRKGAR